MQKLVELAHSRNIVVICDNTFASPAVCQPHAFGVDVVVESATKVHRRPQRCGGRRHHAEVGLLPARLAGEDVRWNTMNKLGAPLSPFNAWLLLRGAQTLALRLEKQCGNAARWLVIWSSIPR